MKIYAFVGPSGTGKSYRAQWVARENNLECIIDDGLLIKNNKVLAGKSAKKEASKIASVKRAVFTDLEHREEVKEAIKRECVNGLLILGTSDDMVEKIANALELPPIEKKIYIEDVATEKEIEKAKYMRKELDKHVIPVPTVEVKNQFSGYFLNPLKVFKSKNKDSETFEAEKTIVRPTFSYLGEYTISESVVNAIIYHVGETVKGVQRMQKIRNKNTKDGVKITIELIVCYGIPIQEIMQELAQKVKAEVEKVTALNIIELNIIAKGIFMA